MRHAIAHLFLDMAAGIVRRVHPPETVQLAAVRLIDRSAPLLARAYGVGRRARYHPDRRATMLSRMLCTITERHPAFTLHSRIEQSELLADATAGGRGVLVCTPHMRLAYAAHRALHLRGLNPVFVSVPGNVQRGSHWGDAAPLTVLDADRADILFLCARHIAAGDVVIAFVDYRLDPPVARGVPAPVAISPNAFAWAGIERVPLLFMAPRLAPDGHIVLEFARPRPGSGAATARAFADFIEPRTGWRCIVQRRKDATGAFSASQGA